MRILGIDPGIGRLGWGVIDENAGKLKAVAYGCFETSSKEEVPKRLGMVYGEMLRIIKKYAPDTLSIEDLFFGTNTKTAFVVGQARGVILLAASEKKLSIHIYTPLEVKVAVTGYGRAEKAQIGKMVKTILALSEIPKPDDTTDALAIALAHAFSSRSAKYRR